jgi:alkaline phosphatase
MASLNGVPRAARKKKYLAGPAFLTLFVAATLMHCTPRPPETFSFEGADKRAKNVILMIGDGMGLGTISSAMYQSKQPLSLEKFPVVGFHKTTATDDLITDSAAGATAFSCGVKTFRSAIGITADSLPCKTILQELKERGLAVGMVVTSTVVHATPAAFIAHQNNRVYYEDIALDFLKTDIDLLIGGGKVYFERRDNDNRNLIQEWINRDYEVHHYAMVDMHDLDLNTRRNLVYFTADKHPLPVTAGRDYLPYASRLAPHFLERRGERGYFLMIEGSQIDWGGHSNDGDWATREMLDFDRAVGVVFDYARRRGNTLVIVTSDHECGGVSVIGGAIGGPIEYGFTTNNHTGAMVPVFAYGPGAELFAGIYDNTAIYFKMRQALGLGKTAATATF